MYAQKLSFDYAHTLHTVRIVHNAHSVHRSRVQKGQSCDCINFVRATDPPYNTGNEGWVYNDNVNDPKIKKWLGEVVGKEGEDLTRHDKWLCMMYPRLKLLQKLLADDGVIFISIDDTEYAKNVLRRERRKLLPPFLQK